MKLATESFIAYFRTGFPEKQAWNAGPNETYSFGEIKNAIARLEKTDPFLHRELEYLWRSRNIPLNSLSRERMKDSSTMKRTWAKALSIIKNYLTYPEITPNLPSLDSD